MTNNSSTPLSTKLGIKEGFKLFVKNPPENYTKLLEPIPTNVRIRKRISNDLDIIHFFTKKKSELNSHVKAYMGNIRQNGVIWIFWPKKASKIPTDLTENAIRDIVLPLGLVDIKVCAIDAIWSGLKLVIRKENRK
jgi:hypothetical protein